MPFLFGKNREDKRNKNFIFLFVFILAFFSLLCADVGKTFASNIIGHIDDNNKYAWGENTGWINFKCDNCNVVVEDDYISGYAWNGNFGWINLSPDNAGVKNNGEGNLSGYAWGGNIGWINFDDVSIDKDGFFSGYATITNNGNKISFNCSNESSCDQSNFKLRTDWRPRSVRAGSSGSVPSGTSSSTTTGASGGGNNTVTTNPPTNEIQTNENANTTPPSNSIAAIFPNILKNITVPISNLFSDAFGKTLDILLKTNNYFTGVFDNIFYPKSISTNIALIVPKEAQPSLRLAWNLLPIKTINSFVFAPLPYDVRTLAAKLPEFGNTLQEVGVTELRDLDKLAGVTFKIPGLSNRADALMNNIGVGKIALEKGIPVTDFPLAAKKDLPTEFVFARADDELVDLNVALSVGDNGEVTQKVASLPGKILKLVVKPISKARSVTGYLVFKSATPRVAKNEISRSSLTASALFSLAGVVEKVENPVPVENKLVLTSFEYTDPDHDGIYTADVTSPATPGEYEVVTVIEYVDPTLGTRQMRMVAVIDPEGYIYEKNNGKETRIPNAIISLYYLDMTTKKYELWPAKDYQQDNPQVTDVRGTYSFLVPEGTYYFTVEAPGYKPYQGKAFVVTEGSGIHENIEMKSDRGLSSVFDIKTILLIAVLLLLIYNLYRSTLREKLLRFLSQHDK